MSGGGGDKIEEKIDGGLMCEDGKFLYLICNEVPVLLMDEAIAMEQSRKFADPDRPASTATADLQSFAVMTLGHR